MIRKNIQNKIRLEKSKIHVKKYQTVKKIHKIIK